jgi:HYDIN/CFA65/VesB family protein
MLAGRTSLAVYGGIVIASVMWLSSAGLAQPSLPNKLNVRDGAITIRYPAGWSSPPRRFANMDEIINIPADKQDTLEPTVRIKITVVTRTDHADAARQLREIASENTSRAASMRIGGWPAIQRRHLGIRQQPDDGSKFADKMVLTVTTAIAAGNLLVRLEASLPSAATQALISQVEAIERSVTFATQGNPARADLDMLDLHRRGAPRPARVALPSTPQPASRNAAVANDATASATRLALARSSANPPQWPFQDPPLTRLFVGGNGELEVAASNNGRNIVVARQRLFRSSTDGGQTFSAAASLPFTNSDGDPSLAVARSGNFYMAGLGCFDATPSVRCVPMAQAPSTGQPFTFLNNSVTCPSTGANACSPDQEHIAADRVNAGTGGGDQVYVVWRNFDSTDQDPAIVCSQDSGATWTAVPINVESPGLVPRIAVGQDGFVYVIYRASFPNGNIRLNKYSSCRNGLTQQVVFPVTVAAVTDVTCPVSGLDRCNLGGNILSSHTVAVDDTNANHVYVAYADSSGGAENVLVRDSLNGGQTWLPARVVTLNAAAAGRRFMPWVSTGGGEAFVAWYDRRAASPASNDLTEYFGGRARLDTLGNLVAGPEFKISKVVDPQCASGWPSAPRSPADATSCNAPQLAGVCSGGAGRCDFNVGCPAPQTCNTGGGAPKYGDYNGTATGAGRFFTAFASATSPPEITPPSAAIDVFFTTLLVGNVPQIQVPSGVAFGTVCAGSAGQATLSICNTGNASLSVTGIASSNPQFAVVAPSGGFPVVIAPGSCFPFEVTFTPTGVGPQVATLTISSDDPSTPSVTVQATARGAAGSLGLSPNLRFSPTVLQNIGACESQKPFVISNTGTCDLTITNIAMGGADAGDFSFSGLPALPITLGPGHIAGAGDLDAVFAPTILARERTANITVTFVSNPTTGSTSSQTRDLCGEGVRTGARVLVTQGGVPLPQVHEIELKRFGGLFGFAKEVDEVREAALQTVAPTPGTACAALQFHREYGALTNPGQLRPGRYQLKVEAKIAGHEVRKEMWFNVDTCGFDGTIVVDF